MGGILSKIVTLLHIYLVFVLERERERLNMELRDYAYKLTLITIYYHGNDLGLTRKLPRNGIITFHYLPQNISLEVR